jgi:hypothetical protein
MPRLSDHLKNGRSLPRGSWHGVDPQSRVVPAKKGRRAPYHRQTRRQQDVRRHFDSQDEAEPPLVRLSRLSH